MSLIYLTLIPYRRQLNLQRQVNLSRSAAVQAWRARFAGFAIRESYACKLLATRGDSSGSYDQPYRFRCTGVHTMSVRRLVCSGLRWYLLNVPACVCVHVTDSRTRAKSKFSHSVTSFRSKLLHTSQRLSTGQIHIYFFFSFTFVLVKASQYRDRRSSKGFYRRDLLVLTSRRHRAYSRKYLSHLRRVSHVRRIFTHPPPFPDGIGKRHAVKLTRYVAQVPFMSPGFADSLRHRAAKFFESSVVRNRVA